MSCGTLRLTDQSGCCGSLRPTSITPPQPPTPVALGESTTLVDPTGAGVIAKPGGVVDGTILIAAVGHNDSTVTPPVDFIEIGPTGSFDAGFAGFNWEQTIYYKVVIDAGSEPATYTFDGNGLPIDIWLVAVQNGDPGASPDITQRPIIPEVGTNSTGASVVAPANGSLLLRFETSNSENRDTGPAGMTALSGSPIDTSFNADSESVNAGLTGTRDSTYVNPQTWIVHMVVVGPIP